MPRRGAAPAPGSEVGDAMGRLYARGALRCEECGGYHCAAMSVRTALDPDAPDDQPAAYPLGAAPWAARLDVETALAALRAGGLVCLDSAGGAPARWSLIAFDPLVSFEGADAPADLDGLAAALARVELDPKALADPLVASSPFCGGFVGALAYDLGVRGRSSTCPRPVAGAADRGGLYGDWLLIESGSGGATLFLPTRPGARRRPNGAPRSSARSRRRRRGRAGSSRRRRTGRAARAVPAGSTWPDRSDSRAHRGGRDLPGQRRPPPERRSGRRGRRAVRTLRAATPRRTWGSAASGSRTARRVRCCPPPRAPPRAGPDATGARVARTRPIKGTAPRGESPAEDAAVARGSWPATRTSPSWR